MICQLSHSFLYQKKKEKKIVVIFYELRWDDLHWERPQNNSSLRLSFLVQFYCLHRNENRNMNAWNWN